RCQSARYCSLDCSLVLIGSWPLDYRSVRCKKFECPLYSILPKSRVCMVRNVPVSGCYRKRGSRAALLARNKMSDGVSRVGYAVPPMARRQLVLLDLERFVTAPLHNDPCPYVVVPGFVKPVALERINAEFPAITKPGNFPFEELTYGPAFREFVEELRGAEM